MKYRVEIKLHDSSIDIELDDSNSPKTVKEFVEKLPFTVDLNVWGDEIYSSKSPITQPEENAQSPVELNDVAYWPTGKAICLFYGPTPIGKPGEITPASPVNIIGKIVFPDKQILEKAEGETATFTLQN
ncbi:cyclophilin-like fold protein [Nitrosopumilus sp.]|uniref:cyclophilin-like fold protein n=1 Tax=Nitrosopumilus sp. TaxID=2024843 RepID=UPI00260CEA01|nr:cyclophilin-like fold protein [Nitrosopumilus sp.]